MTPARKKFKTSQEVTHEDLIEMALKDPMGDGVRSMFAQTIYGRVKAQAERVGVFPPAWPAFIDALRRLDCVEQVYQNPSNKYEDPIVDIKYLGGNGPVVDTWLKSSGGEALTNTETEALEAMIDRTSLKVVANVLSYICNGKAEHITTNWQDPEAAIHWERAAGRLDTLADKVKV